MRHDTSTLGEDDAAVRIDDFNCSEVKEFVGRIRIQAMLKPFLLSSAFGLAIFPSINCPLQSDNELYFELLNQVPAKEIVQSIQQIKQHKVTDNDLKVSRSTATWFTFELNGNIMLQQVRLHPRTGSTNIGSRIKAVIVGDLEPGLDRNSFLSNSNKHRRTCCRMTSIAFFVFRLLFFACRKLAIPWKSTGGVNRNTSHTAHVQHVQMSVSPHITHDVRRSRMDQV